MRPPRGTAVSSTSGAPAAARRDALAARPAPGASSVSVAPDAHDPRRHLAARAVEQRDRRRPGRARSTRAR